MIGGTFSNRPVKDTLYVSFDQLDQYVSLESSITQIISQNTSLQEILIDISDYSLQSEDIIYPIAASEKNTLRGEFHVLEKWRYPYWKKNGKLYVPSDKNPIGTYLIILADLQKQDKIPISIHEWPKAPYTTHDFRKGDFSKGCIRMRPDDISTFFNSLEIGAKVIIQN